MSLVISDSKHIFMCFLINCSSSLEKWLFRFCAYFYSDWFSLLMLSCSVQPLSHVQLFVTHGLQHTRLPCPSPTPGVCSNSCPLRQWCHPTISSCVIPFSCFNLPASGSFPVSLFFASSGQSFGVSASASVLLLQERGPCREPARKTLPVTRSGSKDLAHKGVRTSGGFSGPPQHPLPGLRPCIFWCLAFFYVP